MHGTASASVSAVWWLCLGSYRMYLCDSILLCPYGSLCLCCVPAKLQGWAVCT